MPRQSLYAVYQRRQGTYGGGWYRVKGIAGKGHILASARLIKKAMSARFGDYTEFKIKKVR
jgi:hypothetical protein